MLTRIVIVVDVDHFYRWPVDPVHIGSLQRGGVCIIHDPASWEEKSARCFISIFVCVTIAISWTTCLKRAVVLKRPGSRMRRAVITTCLSSDTLYLVLSLIRLAHTCALIFGAYRFLKPHLHDWLFCCSRYRPAIPRPLFRVMFVRASRL